VPTAQFARSRRAARPAQAARITAFSKAIWHIELAYPRCFHPHRELTCRHRTSSHIVRVHPCWRSCSKAAW
jgi:hypothetical protein